MQHRGLNFTQRGRKLQSHCAGEPSRGVATGWFAAVAVIMSGVMIRIPSRTETVALRGIKFHDYYADLDAPG